ncbi:hypothetical protein IU500_12565 [Nocardia terpenica]|nr:hypothetical protein [Nocardia terpenica]MBF6062989.1 hypothetical protein [Nocardia terpenica]MBF6104876.1 hypothetical protein [Nocardia terpenica]MBF6112687.1 hypothetical protein [Nocardia terpenica]MBF6118604.1 hypothetical protein [Nocardia terpenica]MBF6155083.1 hypothetical protein [Nocardia terpenica]
MIVPVEIPDALVMVGAEGSGHHLPEIIKTAAPAVSSVADSASPKTTASP